MKKGKRLMILVTVMGLILSTMLSGCSSGTQPNSTTTTKKPKIAVVLMALNSDYWNMVSAGAKKAAKDYNVDVAILGPSAETDVTGQVSIVEDQVTSKASAIVLAALQPSSILPSLNKAKDAKIPVVLIDTDVKWDDKVSYVGTKNVDGGKSAGEYLASKLTKGAKVAIIRGIEGSPTHDDRATGAIDALKAAGMNVVTIQPANSDRGLAMTVTENILQSTPDLAAIYGTNDEMALGALKAVEGAKKKVLVVGFDGEKDALTSITAGALGATVAQHPIDEGYKGVEAAAKALKGESVDKRIDTGTEVITKDNVAQFMAKIATGMGT